jgi:alpha-D-ribose 1-methylphosphonate 5-triphosphate synthase subunit PhnG
MEADDKVLVECNLQALISFVEELEKSINIKVVREPGICLTMVRAEDSVEKQEFYLGEALTTECEVLVDNQMGYGVCLGDEPQRAYCIAVVDALLQSGKHYNNEIKNFLETQAAIIVQNEQEEFDQIMRTRVDFKLMDEQ